MPVFRQNSFVGGALNPSLEGRTDFAKRLAGARRIHNFLVTPYGTLRRRPGFRTVGRLYGSGGLLATGSPSAPDLKGRVLTFRDKDNIDVLIVLGHRKGVALRSGRRNEAAARTRFDTPWAGRDLNPDPFDGTKPGIKWAQSGRRLLITHPDYPPLYIIAPEREDRDWTTSPAELLLDQLALSQFSAEYVAGVSTAPPASPPPTPPDMPDPDDPDPPTPDDPDTPDDPEPEPESPPAHAPQNIVVTGSSSSPVLVRWDAVYRATGYDVRWRLSTQTTYVVGRPFPGSRFINTTFRPARGTTVEVQVRAYNNAGASAWSPTEELTV